MKHGRRLTIVNQNGYPVLRPPEKSDERVSADACVSDERSFRYLIKIAPWAAELSAELLPLRHFILYVISPHGVFNLLRRSVSFSEKTLHALPVITFLRSFVFRNFRQSNIP